MQKYQEMFLTKLKDDLAEWSLHEEVPQHEVYRFLHAMKGTAASIGMESFTASASAAMDRLSDDETKVWPGKELHALLADILSLLSPDGSHEIRTAAHSGPAADLSGPAADLSGPSAYLSGAASSEAAAGSPERSAASFEADAVSSDGGTVPLVLIAGGDIQYADSLKSGLERIGWNVMIALTGEKAVEMLYDRRPDGVLLDLDFPGNGGLEMLALMQEKAMGSMVPVIVLASDDSKQTRLQAYRLGSADVLTKPFDPDELIIRMQSRLRHMKVVKDAMLIDELTGAYNRKFLTLEMNRLYQEYSRTGETFALAVADIDYFKKVNDTYGHDTGDVVLRMFARTIRKEIRSSDVLIRYGGEEFIILFPKTRADRAKLTLDRIRLAISAVPVAHEKGTFSVAFSAGVTELAYSWVDPDKLIKQADLALYAAKQAGRNRVEVFSEQADYPSVFSGLRVVIVDDDHMIHRVLEDHLSNMQLADTPAETRSFREGESLLNSEWFQQQGKYLILLDGMLPKMDGLEVLHQIRQRKSNRECIVIMLTGRKAERDIVRALELGADDYITKPFSIVELEARIKRWAARIG